LPIPARPAGENLEPTTASEPAPAGPAEAGPAADSPEDVQQ